MENNTTTPATEEVPSEPVTQAVVVIEPEKVTAPDAVKPEPEREIDYTIRDVLFPPFHVYKCSHAWWSERRKVERLIEAFKSGVDVKEAWIYAGITKGQWDYFKEFHPDFSAVREACEAQPIFIAIDSVNKGLPNDPKLAFAYLRAAYPKFRDKLKVETDQPLTPTTNGPIIAGAVDTTEITKALDGIAGALLARRGGKDDSSN